jgi:hypothetical protein
VSNFFASYEVLIKGKKKPKKWGCIVPALDAEEARKKILEKPRKPHERVVKVRISRLA